MVMDLPSAQNVGREFVRQYYTLMNEAPEYLHRFYSGDSSFVHSEADLSSGEAEAVYGQKDIHKKIQELNFQDCHTKIRQVDSQATVGNAVVVQVTGELSNRSGPLRRFMQTFVLAHQNPKQYYVHNDIFRYQDEVFRDLYGSEVDDSDSQSVARADEQPVVVNGIEAEPEHAEPEVDCPVNSRVEDVNVAASQQDLELNVQSPPVESAPTTTTMDFDEPMPAEKETQPLQDQPKIMSSESKTEEIAEPVMKTSSWAKIAGGGSGGSAGTAAVAVVSPLNSVNTVKPVVPLSVITSQQKEESMAPVAVAAPATQEEPAVKANRPDIAPSARQPPRDYGVDRRTNERFPDNQQVFVGNLPQDVAELQLKNFFKGYGKVLDIRINRGGGGSGKVPFGFVVFDSEEPVQTLLKMKRVEMEGHRLNVEEKKARSDRPGSTSRMARGPKQQLPRAGSRPKDRESSGSRPDNRMVNQRKAGRQ